MDFLEKKIKKGCALDFLEKEIKREDQERFLIHLHVEYDL